MITEVVSDSFQFFLIMPFSFCLLVVGTTTSKQKLNGIIYNENVSFDLLLVINDKIALKVSPAIKESSKTFKLNSILAKISE